MSPFAPRHFLSIADLTPAELVTLVRSAKSHKNDIKKGLVPKKVQESLNGRTVAMMFNKRSTRTRVSTEAAVVTMGGHPMFLGKDDIQLGVSQCLPTPSYTPFTLEILIPICFRSMNLSTTHRS